MTIAERLAVALATHPLPVPKPHEAICAVLHPDPPPSAPRAWPPSSPSWRDLAAARRGAAWRGRLVPACTHDADAIDERGAVRCSTCQRAYQAPQTRAA